MKKHQKGFTLTELLICLVMLLLGSVIVFGVVSAIYAIGKYLFHWWG